ncbi:unnamed protein product [Penicillium salamii]|nr:unnamed protein product [Penicillium salamii]
MTQSARYPLPHDHLKPFPSSPAPSQTAAKPLDNAQAEVNQNGDPDTMPESNDLPPLPAVVARIHSRVKAFLNETHPEDSLLASVQRQTRISLGVVSSALKRYKLSELSVSYNGGKDCLVLLILFLAGLHPENNPEYTTSPPASTLRSSFEDYLARHPGIRAIFVGTRRTDPHGAQLTHFDRTDGGWPDFMRVHPVIDWHYAEIWAFIRHLDLRYCSLYDEGYTSLGGTSDTHPNPKLQNDGEYLPAYQLTEDVEERLGRN